MVLPSVGAATYETHRQEFRRLFRPQTALQNFLLERMVAIAWKLIRIQEAEQHLYELEAARAVLPDDPGDDRVELSPGEVLARRLAGDPQNSFLLLHRYEQALYRELHTLIRRFPIIQKIWPTTPYSDEELAEFRAAETERHREVEAYVTRCADEANRRAMGRTQPQSLPAADQPIPAAEDGAPMAVAQGANGQ